MIKTFKVKVNNKEFEVEVEELKKASKQIIVETKTSTEKTTKKAEVKPEVKAEKERNAPVVIPKLKKPELKEQVAGKQDLLAPLPGVILEVLVKKGKKVKENEPVVVLEAMKMENSLLAPISGIVEEIHIKEGQNVDGNYPLITING